MQEVARPNHQDTIKRYPPGSREARAEGCRCPVMDNGHGLGMYRNRETGDPVFVITAECPLHGTKDDSPF